MPLLDTSRLEALVESASLLNASLDLDELLRHLLRSVMGRLLVGKACVAVADAGTMRMAIGRGVSKLVPGEPFDEAVARACGIDVVLPIGAPEAPVGLLGLARPDETRFEAEEGFIGALLGMAATSITNARAHARAAHLAQELGQKVQELRALLDLVKGFAAAAEPEDVAHMLALTLAGRWAITRYAVAAWKQGHPPVVRQRGFQIEDPLRLDALLDSLPDVAHVDQLERGDWRTWLEGQHARLLLPIRSTAVRGFVALGPRPGHLTFDAGADEFSSALVGQAAVAFENAWHFRETLAKRKVEQEFALAASIQKGLFPSCLPELPGYDTSAFNRPASQVGGDYYDVLPSPGEGPVHSCLFCVADVSGKGLPASLLMSSIQATLRALQGQTPSLRTLMGRINELLYASTPGNKYATALFANIDGSSGQVTYVNAGHSPGVLLRADGNVELLDACGPPVGLLTDLGFEEKQLELRAGDTLALFSDGVTEAWNADEDEFGEARLVDVLRAAARGNAEDTVTTLVDEIDAFAGSAPQHDDITILIVKRQ